MKKKITYSFVFFKSLITVTFVLLLTIKPVANCFTTSTKKTHKKYNFFDNDSSKEKEITLNIEDEFLYNNQKNQLNFYFLKSIITSAYGKESIYQDIKLEVFSPPPKLF